jgi:hypothetical protein
MTVALILALLTTPGAQAQEDAGASGIEITKLGDIYPHLPPEGARNWQPQPLVDAIRGSGLTFSPKDVYELVDNRVHPDVIKIVADMAALYYDGSMQPLSEMQAMARKGQPRTSLDLTEGNFVQLFEFFNDVQNEIAEAESRVGPKKPKQPDESVSVFERRVRAWEERRVKAVGPFEGRGEAMTFNLTLPATVQDRDGCKRPVAQVVLTDLDFDLFRTGMGVKALENVVEVSSGNIERMAFTVEGDRRFEALGRCNLTSTRLRATLQRTWEGAWTGSGSF